MYMQKKYNYNRHLCKKIDKLEDFTVEYKNDPFKAIKLFIDCYKWYRDPTKNLLPAELAGETVSSVEAYVKNVIKTTAERWAICYCPRDFQEKPDTPFFRGFSYDNDGVYIKNDDYIGVGYRSHPVSFVNCDRIYFEIYLPYLINRFIGPAFIHTNYLRVFNSKEYTVSVSECLDFTPKHYICASERDAFELIYLTYETDYEGHITGGYDNTDILHQWEKKTFCPENYKAHGLYVPMKPNMQIIKKFSYVENSSSPIRGGNSLDVSTLSKNNTNDFLNDF